MDERNVWTSPVETIRIPKEYGPVERIAIDKNYNLLYVCVSGSYGRLYMYLHTFLRPAFIHAMEAICPLGIFPPGILALCATYLNPHDHWKYMRGDDTWPTGMWVDEQGALFICKKGDIYCMTKAENWELQLHLSDACDSTDHTRLTVDSTGSKLAILAADRKSVYVHDTRSFTSTRYIPQRSYATGPCAIDSFGQLCVLSDPNHGKDTLLTRISLHNTEKKKREARVVSTIKSEDLSNVAEESEMVALSGGVFFLFRCRGCAYLLTPITSLSQSGVDISVRTLPMIVDFATVSGNKIYFGHRDVIYEADLCARPTNPIPEQNALVFDKSSTTTKKRRIDSPTE